MSEGDRVADGRVGPRVGGRDRALTQVREREHLVPVEHGRGRHVRGEQPGHEFVAVAFRDRLGDPRL
jgi:hypothetical protein